MQLFITMCERGLVAEGATYLALISTCAKAQQWQLSEEIMLCTIAEPVPKELVRKVGAPDASRMPEKHRELLTRLQNWRHAHETELAAQHAQHAHSAPVDATAQRAAGSDTASPPSGRPSVPHSRASPSLDASAPSPTGAAL